MYGFVDVASISKSVIDFLTKRINLDAVVEKIISVIFISILMYFSIKIGNKLIDKLLVKRAFL